MEMPEVKRCFGMFPPKYATYLISLFGMSSGGVGLAGIILYGIAEDSIVAHVFGKVDESVKKVCLLSIGLSSLMLLLANLLLFLGVTSKSGRAVSAGYLTILLQCLILMVISIALPLSCFFMRSVCIIKQVSTALTVLAIIFISFYLQIWLYFMVVAWNFAQSIQ